MTASLNKLQIKNSNSKLIALITISVQYKGENGQRTVMDIFLDKPQNAFNALRAADYEDGDWLCRGGVACRA
jgi:hypothetical protein